MHPTRDVEAVLLTGGASRRMGASKAELVVGGMPLAAKLAGDLASVCTRVTVLGQAPLGGFEFLADAEEFAGPLAAIARFVPVEPYVFVASCDMPAFDPAVVDALRNAIGEAKALVPLLDGFAQSLCALYIADCFRIARALAAAGERSMRALLAATGAATFTPEALGVSAKSLASVNTPGELSAILADS